MIAELEQERALRKELQAKLDRFENIDGVEGDTVLALQNEVGSLDTQLEELRLQLCDYQKWFNDEDANLENLALEDGQDGQPEDQAETETLSGTFYYNQT